MSRFTKTMLTYHLLDWFEENYDTASYTDEEIKKLEFNAYVACMNTCSDTCREYVKAHADIYSEEATPYFREWAQRDFIRVTSQVSRLTLYPNT